MLPLVCKSAPLENVAQQIMDGSTMGFRMVEPECQSQDN